jgi:hypothetical protein
MEQSKHADHNAHAAHGSMAHHDPQPAGLAASEQGYTLQLESDTLPPTGGGIRFAITDPHGRAVQNFVRVHERELHLIVVSRSLDDYSHVHPTRDATGTWSVRMPPREPGAYRLYADFSVEGGPALTLRGDVVVRGESRGRSTPAPSKIFSVDGFDVALDGRLEANSSARIGVRVSRQGTAVELEPYLGANAHLVVIRAADGAFLHVHPLHEDSPVGEVGFSAVLPSNGRYRFFVDFKVEGAVRTAAFSVDVPSRS